MCSNHKLLDQFTEANKLLDSVQKGLADYLETKRLAFARFFFLSNDELLQILSQSKNPLAVQPHLRKCFEAIQSLEFGEGLAITAMTSQEGERVGVVGLRESLPACYGCQSMLHPSHAAHGHQAIDSTKLAAHTRINNPS